MVKATTRHSSEQYDRNLGQWSFNCTLWQSDWPHQVCVCVVCISHKDELWIFRFLLGITIVHVPWLLRASCQDVPPQFGPQSMRQQKRSSWTHQRRSRFCFAGNWDYVCDTSSWTSFLVDWTAGYPCHSSRGVFGNWPTWIQSSKCVCVGARVWSLCVRPKYYMPFCNC